VSARERFFEKVQQQQNAGRAHEKSATREVAAFCAGMDRLVQQITAWFAGSVMVVERSTKSIQDMSAIGYSLSSGICRYEIATLCIRNGSGRVSIIPEQLCLDGDIGHVIMSVVAPGSPAETTLFYLCMAPEGGWRMRGEVETSGEGVALTEEVFFQAIARLA